MSNDKIDGEAPSRQTINEIDQMTQKSERTHIQILSRNWIRW